MTRSATRARICSARAQGALSALLCVAASTASCRRDFDGLKPDERPQVVPRPPAGAPPARPPTGTPPPIVGGSGGNEGGSSGGGGSGGGSGATDGSPGDGLAPGIPPAAGDAAGADVAATDATAPEPDAFPPEAVFGDTGRPEVASPGGGVVMYLPLDEGTGAGVAEDASGNLAIGTLAGLDVRRAWVGGRFGSALRFPRGGGASIRVSPVPSLNTVEMTWSLSVWVRLTGDMNGDGFIVSRRAQSAGGFVYAFGVTAGVARLRINSGNGYNLDMSAGTPIPRNDWVHLGVTFDKKIARIYMNGAPVAAQMYELGIPQEETPLYLGAGQLSAAGMLGERYAGDLDEIVMYNRVLPASEMTGLARGARPVFP